MSENETSALVPATKEVVAAPRGNSRAMNFNPTTFQEACTWAKMIANSDLAPKDYRGKPGNVLVALQMGAEVGLQPMAALQNIAVINGRPSVWGDAALGIVQASSSYESHKEWIEGEGDAMTAYCTMKRKGQDAQTTSFSVADARKAGLWNKTPSPWQTYPKRMLQMRARGFALRDRFADVMRGLVLAEEAMDIPVEVVKQRETATLDVSKQLGTLSESTEPNRGHGNEGMEQKPETVIEPVEVRNPGTRRASIVVKKFELKTRKPTAEEEKKAKAGNRKATPSDYLLVEATEKGDPLTLYVWEKNLAEAVMGSLEKTLEVDIKKNDRGKEAIQHIHETVIQQEPKQEQASMSPPAGELFK